MKKITVGIVAHVDAGKTTLSEEILFLAGKIRTVGRVDHKDTFMDTDEIERERKITIFSKEAHFVYKDMDMTFLDTPGHVDFSAEMERTLQVMDYAILVINGNEGIQSHTRTLWTLLEAYQVPCFIFVNKMDIAHQTKEKILEEIQTELTSSCIPFMEPDHLFYEEVATCEEGLLEEYLAKGTISADSIAQAVLKRKVYPLLFGSALKNEGVLKLLEILDRYTCAKIYPDTFGARVYKIARDKQNRRLTYMKIMGGSLHVKDALSVSDEYPEDTEKINEIRRYSGERYETVAGVTAGDVCAVSGLTKSYPGQSFGSAKRGGIPKLEPMLSYQVLFSKDVSVHEILDDFRILADEDPLLNIRFNAKNQEIRIDLMGKIQLEVIQQKMQKRFHAAVEFGMGDILYRETIQNPVIGHGHYEPLKHFADVFLKMEPQDCKTGITVETECPQDVLLPNYQHQIRNTLLRREHPGILTGSPLSDVKITIVSGKSHKKHTEGGDFRRATEIAVRNGLLHTEMILLEPFYHVTLVIPQENTGRAMLDFDKMYGRIEKQENHGTMCTIQGKVPVKTIEDYAAEVASYTSGMGHLMLEADGYFPCHNASEVIQTIGYDYKADVKHPYESIYVHQEEPQEVELKMRREEEKRTGIFSTVSMENLEETVSNTDKKKEKIPKPVKTGGMDPLLQEIYLREFGTLQTSLPTGEKKNDVRTAQEKEQQKIQAREAYFAGHKNDKGSKKTKSYVLIDGYNVIFAWPELSSLAKRDLMAARTKLLDIAMDYQGYVGCEMIVVFDAYQVANNPGTLEQYHSVHVVYTKEMQTADSYIERATHEIMAKEKRDVTVITSDGQIQVIAMGEGAKRMSSREFQIEVERVKKNEQEKFHF